jgi:hypothetical protein
MSVESKEIIKRTEKESLRGKILETTALIKYITGENLPEEEIAQYKLENISIDTLRVDELPIDNLMKIKTLLEDPEIQPIIDEDIIGNFMGNVFACVRRIAKSQEEIPKELSDCINKKTQDFFEYLDKLPEINLKAA